MVGSSAAGSSVLALALLLAATGVPAQDVCPESTLNTFDDILLQCCRDADSPDCSTGFPAQCTTSCA
eukprot:COSAG06_NODE_36907_length_441_cov_1.476608_1_plen_66_part_10